MPNVAELREIINQPLTTGEFTTLRDKIRAEKAGRARRNAAFEELVLLASQAGKQAGEEYEDKQAVPVGGAGFAWVTVYPGNTAFARWLVKERGWTTHYRGGVRMSVPAYDQNEGRKYAYAQGFASVLKDAGFKAYAGSRLD